MNFELTEEQQLVLSTARDFARKEIAPKAAELDKTARWPREIVAQMAELGFLGMAVPTEYGGAGLDNVCYALAIEEISRGCGSTGVIMSVNNSLYCDPVMKFGTDAQKKEFLEPFARGEKLGCFGLTEPNAGSDAAAQQTVAVKRGDDYVINGSKNWITVGPKADAMVLFTMTDKSKGNKGITAFLVPTSTPGFNRQPPDKKMGINGAHSCTIYFEDMKVSAKNILGKEGEGFKVAMSTLDGGRIGIAAQAIGIARAAFEEALAYSAERKTFGKPIRDHQAIQFMLADMATELEAARALLYLAAAKVTANAPDKSRFSAMAKRLATDTGSSVVDRALQLFGGYGYLRDYPIERFWRDLRVHSILEGTNEVMRMIIGRDLLRQ